MKLPKVPVAANNEITMGIHEPHANSKLVAATPS
jgi:hypothetical protein